MANPQEKQTVVTPYDLTVVYRCNDYFSNIAAFLVTDRLKVQLVPIINGNVDINTMFDYRTPELVVLGSYFTAEEVANLAAQEFQKIFIFGSGDSTHHKVQYFSLDEFYDVLHVDSRMGATLLMENVLCAEFPDYKSEVTNREDAMALKIAIESSGKSYIENVTELTSWRGFSRFEVMIARGYVFDALRKQILDERVNKYGINFTLADGDNKYSVKAVQATEFVFDTCRAIIAAKDPVQIGMVYAFTIDPQSGKGVFNIVMMSNMISLDKLVPNFSETFIVENQGNVLLHVSPETAHRVLPFLYPAK